MEAREVKILDVEVGPRFRKEMGDVASLAKSIKEIGLLHPIVIRSSDNRLVVGERRLRALQRLGYEKIPAKWVRKIDIESIIQGEHDENIRRKDFLPSELHALAKAMEKSIQASEIRKAAAEDQENYGGFAEELESNIAGNDVLDVSAEDINELYEQFLRQKETLTGKESGKLGGRGNKKGSEAHKKAKQAARKLAKGRELTDGEDEDEYEEMDNSKDNGDEQPEHEEVRDKVAESIGMGRETLRKLDFICAQAENNPAYSKFIDEMDTDGSIDAAFKKAQAAVEKDKKKKYSVSDSLLRISTHAKKVVPDFMYAALTYLPEQIQESLIKKYGNYIFLVKQADFDRGVKNFSKNRGLAFLTEGEIKDALDDILDYTVKFNNRWVFIDQVQKTAMEITYIIEAKGDVDLLDRIEALLVMLSLPIGPLLKYMKRASDEKIIDNIPPEALKLGEDTLGNILKFVDSAMIARVASKRKKLLGEDAITESQGSANSMQVIENLLYQEDEIKHFKKKIEAIQKKMGEPLPAVV